MNKKRLIGTTLLLISISTSLLKTRLTGAIIGTTKLPEPFYISLGTFILGFLILRAATLEQRITTAKAAQPVFIDTSFIIEACKDKETYKATKKFIEERHAEGYPAIVPKTVLGEIRTNMPRNKRIQFGLRKGDVQRMKQLKELLKEKSTTLEELRTSYGQDQQAHISYGDKALRMMNQTTKHFANRSRLRGGQEKGDQEILANTLYLMNFPELYGNTPLNDISILTLDKDLHEAPRIQKKLFPRNAGSIHPYKTLQAFEKEHKYTNKKAA